MSMGEIALEVRELCVNYRKFSPYSVKKGLFEMRRRKSEVFQAVKNVSFTVCRGSILGVVGKNGSGKSTMLKAIAGIFAPDSGSIDLKGNSVSLLSIGVGFQKELTGRENILLSGMLLGFSEEEVRQNMEKIIEFAELGSFIDAPVQTYSSGMYSKLAFSITAMLETDIMLIDEVFSVGDAKFKKKSYQKMKHLISDKHRTAILVSHDVKTLKKLCDAVLWMQDGQVKLYGETKAVLHAYHTEMYCLNDTRGKA